MSNFDPTYGYTQSQLLTLPPPTPPADFSVFWQARYARAMTTHPRPRLTYSQTHADYEVFDCTYRSTNDVEIGGWLLIPRRAPVTCGLVVGHGYGGRDGPDFHWPIPGAALLFPCFRGLSRSRRWPISDNPAYHVLHDIDKKDHYILGGCVDDLWLAVSTLLALFPATVGHIGYAGISFGGGIGALALPWDDRIQRAHLNVPTFGNHPLRLQLPSQGSAAAVRNFQHTHPKINVLATLAYYDAACAAQWTCTPVHMAAALADPVVAPPGQFSIYNGLAVAKQLFLLDWGHADYPRRAAQEQALSLELQEFFAKL